MFFSQSYNGIKPPFGVKLNSSHSLARGLVGCWLFNEGAGSKVFDLSGNNNIGTLTDMESDDWIGGKDGFGLNFDQINNHIKVPNSTSLDIINNQMSIHMLICPGLGGTQHNTFIRKADTTEKLIFRNNAFTVGLTGFLETTAGIVSLTNKGTLTQDAWQIVSFVYNGSSLKLYIEGKEVDSVAQTGNIVSDTDDLYIGWQNGSSRFFGGKIGFVYIYETGHSPTEILQLLADPYVIFQQSAFPNLFGFSAVAGNPWYFYSQQ